MEDVASSVGGPKRTGGGYCGGIGSSAPGLPLLPTDGCELGVETPHIYILIKNFLYSLDTRPCQIDAFSPILSCFYVQFVCARERERD